jgi:uncharacterized coiled-coil protein SlyX
MTEDALAGALIAKLQPAFYTIGLIVVFIFVSFGGTIISLWWKARNKEQDKLTNTLESLQRLLAENTLSITKMDAKLELYIEKHEKDLNNLGNKIRSMDA